MNQAEKREFLIRRLLDEDGRYGGMEIPAGMKNPTSGDFSVMMNSVIAAQHAHTFLFRQWEVQTTGNP